MLRQPQAIQEVSLHVSIGVFHLHPNSFGFAALFRSFSSVLPAVSYNTEAALQPNWTFFLSPNLV